MLLYLSSLYQDQLSEALKQHGGEVRLETVKLILLGEPCAGKTTLKETLTDKVRIELYHVKIVFINTLVWGWKSWSVGPHQFFYPTFYGSNFFLSHHVLRQKSNRITFISYYQHSL